MRRGAHAAAAAAAAVGARAGRTPLARQRGACRDLGNGSAASPDGTQTKEAVLTFSGKVRVSMGSDIWTRVASVMKRSGANIQAASGTFVRMPRVDAGTAFSVSAFGAHISPSLHAMDTFGDEELLGCTLYIKAVIPENGVAKMMQFLPALSPLQVYTVSIGATKAVRIGTETPAPEGQTGTLYLFGVDKPGQLSEITKVLGQFGVTILHLRVQRGIADVEEGDFVQATGGGLAENRIKIILDGMRLDEGREELLRQELARVSQEFGYAVTCLMMDGKDRMRAVMPSYLLRRKAFAMTYHDATTRPPRRWKPARARCLFPRGAALRQPLGRVRLALPPAVADWASVSF